MSCLLGRYETQAQRGQMPRTLAYREESVADPLVALFFQRVDGWRQLAWPACCLTKECYPGACCRLVFFFNSLVDGCGHVGEGCGGGQRSRAAARCPRSQPVRRRRIVHMSMACRARSARPPGPGGGERCVQASTVAAWALRRPPRTISVTRSLRQAFTRRCSVRS